MPNSFGKLFTISTWGESHGPSVGVVIDGCPPRLPLSQTEVQAELDRRRPGQSDITTPRKEADTVEFLSGIFEDTTTGQPLAMLVRNADARSEAYDEMREKFRPSHADFTYLDLAHGVEIRAFVTHIHHVVAPSITHFPTLAEVEATAVRCPHPATAAKMIERIKEVRAEGDSVGGIIECRIRKVPAGWGEPVFDRLEADLAKAMLSLPATKAFEIGSGFTGTLLKGSQHNDAFVAKRGKVRTASNHSGGVQGGISNGEEIIFRVGFKPTATIMQVQDTVDLQGKATQLKGRGRHDPCVVPRAVVIVEAMAALVLVDHCLRHSAQNRTFKF